MTDRPLTPEEVEFFNHCNHLWCEPGFGMSSMQTGELSDELKARLVALGEVYGLEVRFTIEPVVRGRGEEQSIIQQPFVLAARTKKTP